MSDLIICNGDSVFRAFRDSNYAKDAPEQHPVSEKTILSGNSICCTMCSHIITDTRHLIQIEGQHVHSKKNPSGLSFLFVCFKFAGGCKKSGTPTSDASWFSGCQWRFAHCQMCDFQLGWYFSGGKNFYALILENIKECNEK